MLPDMRFMLCIVALVNAVSAYRGWDRRWALITDYEWKYFDYVWDEQHKKSDYIEKGLYDYKRMFPIDVDRSVDGRTFVTIVRFDGVPASLHTVSNLKGESGPLLKPYPNWSWYENLECDKIINVYRVAIDECNRLWVLDAGTINPWRHPCPAKLLVFNLNNDQLLFKREIPADAAQNKNGKGFLITPVLETYGQGCADTTVYMADLEGDGLVILNDNRTHRLEADEFRAEKENINFTVAGESIRLDNGISALAVSPLQYGSNKRFLIFKPISSKSLYGASTAELKRSTDVSKINFYKGRDVFTTQATLMDFSSGGTLFYGLPGETAIGCWNINNPMEARYFRTAIQDPVRLQFVTGLKVKKNPLYGGYDDYILVMSNRLQKIYKNTLNYNETNYHITRASVRQVISGTVCDRWGYAGNI